MNLAMLILGVIALIVSIAVMSEEDVDGYSKFCKFGFGFGFILVILSLSFSIIPTGYTGVKTTFGQISSETLQNGFNLKAPFIQSIKKVNNKQQDITFKDKIWSVTAENTNVFMENVVVTYQISTDKSAWIYANVSNYKENLVSSVIVQSALKSASVTLSTDKIPNRGLIEPVAVEYLQKAFDEKYSPNTVIINAVNIGNIDFEEGYNQALEQKQLAQKAYETAQITNQTNVSNAESNAKAKILTAQAEAEEKLIKARAEAEASEILNQELTDRVLMNKYIERWNGVLPTVTDGDGNIIDISSLIK